MAERDAGRTDSEFAVIKELSSSISSISLVSGYTTLALSSATLSCAATQLASVNVEAGFLVTSSVVSECSAAPASCDVTAQQDA